MRARKKNASPRFCAGGQRCLSGHYYQTSEKTYTLVNQTDKPRVVYIEHRCIRMGVDEQYAKPDARARVTIAFAFRSDRMEKVDLPVKERRALMDHTRCKTSAVRILSCLSRVVHRRHDPRSAERSSTSRADGGNRRRAFKRSIKKRPRLAKTSSVYADNIKP